MLYQIKNYLFSSYIWILLCYQIYDILNFILKNKKLSTDINQFGLMSLICVWYFLPFNIGGQIWSSRSSCKSKYVFLNTINFDKKKVI